MDLSIVIPTKNEQKNLPRLLKSLSRSPVTLEIIIIDNFSTDKTEKIAQKSKEELKNKIKLRYFKKGPERSVQKNFGAKVAKANYLLFLDADMEIPKPLLTEIKDLIGSQMTAVIIPEKSKGHDFWGQAVSLERNCYQGIHDLEAPRLFEIKLFHKVHGFDPKLIAGEDWDIKNRLEKQGVKISKTRNHLLHHEVSGFFPNLKRKWYYTEHIGLYAQKHPETFSRQSKISKRLQILWRYRSRLAKKPLHTLAFLLLKSIIFTKWLVTKYEIKTEKKI